MFVENLVKGNNTLRHGDKEDNLKLSKYPKVYMLFLIFYLVISGLKRREKHDCYIDCNICGCLIIAY